MEEEGHYFLVVVVENFICYYYYYERTMKNNLHCSDDFSFWQALLQLSIPLAAHLGVQACKAWSWALGGFCKHSRDKLQIKILKMVKVIFQCFLGIINLPQHSKSLTALLGTWKVNTSCPWATLFLQCPCLVDPQIARQAETFLGPHSGSVHISCATTCC